MSKKQIGGAVCSLCGAAGTNKSSCPLNKEAKNPNPAKHNARAQAAAPSSKSQAPQIKQLQQAAEARRGKTWLNEQYKAIPHKHLIKVNLAVTPYIYVRSGDELKYRANPGAATTVSVGANAAAVVSWYKSIFSDDKTRSKILTENARREGVARSLDLEVWEYPEYEEYIAKFNIKHVKDDIFEVSYVLLLQEVDAKGKLREKENIQSWEVADPDERYMFPLEINGVKYHVSGTVVGSKAKVPQRVKRDAYFIKDIQNRM